ncbi:hypothetical protein [Microvirga lenta]|uniref:hypothetical protein n=1 Tax=Microvirga lenta TaxID=2881337 RepID=UPI001CFF7015|nr:hypothetical protein [Microvirga lenta]MCB5177467.1 hypothetical protein [Microvirga lenta]
MRQNRAIQLTALAFTVGLLILVAVEETLGEVPVVSEESRTAAAFFIAGFALLTLVAS